MHHDEPAINASRTGDLAWEERGERGRLRVLQLIVGTLAVGLMGLSGIGLAQAFASLAPPIPDFDVQMGLIVGAVFVACVALSGVIYLRLPVALRRAVSRAEASDEARDTIEQMWAASLISRAALVEAPGLLASVSMLLTGEASFVVGSFASLLMLALLFPTRAGRERCFARAMG